MLNPPTASPAPSTSLSSPSLRIPRTKGLSIGLDKPIDARNVGLDVIDTGLEYELEKELEKVGEDVAEFTFEPGTVTGIAIGRRGVVRVLGEPMFECDSRSKVTEGETARRLEAAGYGSKRSSTEDRFVICTHTREHEQYSRLRLFDRTALVMGGGVYRQ